MIDLSITVLNNDDDKHIKFRDFLNKMDSEYFHYEGQFLMKSLNYDKAIDKWIIEFATIEDMIYAINIFLNNYEFKLNIEFDNI